MQQCVQCNAEGTRISPNQCVPGTPAQDGAGVSGYEFVLYITAEQSACPEAVGDAQTVAFASACQNEVTQDRPIAGTINFCPTGVQNRDPDFAFAVTKHELLHALGFSRFLFSLWRDSNNQPRTARNAGSGLPELDSEGWVETFSHMMIT